MKVVEPLRDHEEVEEKKPTKKKIIFIYYAIGEGPLKLKAPRIVASNSIVAAQISP